MNATAHRLDALTAANDAWQAIDWWQRAPIVDAMRESMAAELEQPQHGPQRRITQPAVINTAWHNDHQADAVPVRIELNLSPIACRLIAWTLQEAIRRGGFDLDGFEDEAGPEADALIKALLKAGKDKELNLPWETGDDFMALQDAGLIDTISEQRARAAYLAG